MVKCANPSCSQDATSTCSKCKLVKYCSKQCQSNHWPEHKKILHKKITLPNLVAEYSSAYPSDMLGRILVSGGQYAIQDMIDTNVQSLLQDDYSQESLAKRWGEISNALIDFLKTAEPGNVFKNKTYCSYDHANRGAQQYRNTPPVFPACLINGTNVIEFGFVDFGMTIDAAHSIKEGDSPVMVYAYEKEPMCVAKTLVMLEMMRTSTTNVRNIVEVWMSTLWSEETFKVFKIALTNILKNVQPPMDSRVQVILQYWSDLTKHKKQVSKKDAMKFWSDRHVLDMRDACMQACNLLSVSDRVSMLRYELTGAFYEDAGTTIGSIVMLHENPSIGVKQICDSCLQSVPTSVHMNATNPDLLPRCREYFEEKVSIFAKHIRNGTLIFKPHLTEIAKDCHDVISFLRSLNAYSIYWSNVPDYMRPEDFHEVAKAISGEDTVHYLHSCNWLNLVYGVDVFDINPDVRGHFYEVGYQMFSLSQRALSGFSSTPVTHFRNMCQPNLLRKYCNHYLRYFFAEEEVVVGAYGMKSVIPHINPLLRATSCAHFTFSYNTSINFGRDSYDYWEEGW